MKNLSLVILFYNEEKNISAFLRSLISIFNSKNVDYEIVAVNNGSTDGTQSLLETYAKQNKRIKLVNIEKNIGYGYGIISGLRRTTGKYVGYCWGDGQIVAKDIYKVFATLKEKNLDICKIKRISRKDSIFRRLESVTYNVIFNVFFSLNLKDINGCPKIMKRDVLTQLHPISLDWFIDAELMIKARKRNFKVLEIPVTYNKREKGKSNVHLTTVFEFAKNSIKFKLKGY